MKNQKTREKREPSATLREELEYIGKCEGMKKDELTDNLMSLILQWSALDPSDIMRSLARVVALDALNNHMASDYSGGEINAGFAACLLRDAARIINATREMEN